MQPAGNDRVANYSDRRQSRPQLRQVNAVTMAAISLITNKPETGGFQGRNPANREQGAKS